MMLHVLIPLLACVTSAVMAALIFVRDTSHRASRHGAVLIGGVSFWALCEVAWNIQDDPGHARAWLRLSGFGWVFIGPLALDVMREIGGFPAPRIRRLRPYLYALSSGFLLATLWTPWMHSGLVATRYGWGYEIGWLHPVFVAFTVACIVIGAWLGWRAYPTAAPGEKAQASIVGAGILMALIVGATTDGLLPMVGYQTIRLGTAAMAIFALSIGWGFYRYGYSLLAPGSFATEILETLPNGVAMLRLDGRIRGVNDTLAQLVGIKSESVVGVDVRELLCGSQIDLAKGFSEVECQLQSTSGARIPVAISSTILRDRQSNPIGLVLVVRDVSEVTELRNSLVVSDRLAAVGEMAAGIAHEINNPLAYVRSNLSLLRRHWKALEGEVSKSGTPAYAAVLLTEGREMIDESLQGVDRAVAIVRDVRGLAHAATSERESADVNTLLDGVIRMAGSQLKRTTAIVKDYMPLPAILCAPQELQQVFLNLVMNAGQAIDDSGEIRVVTRILDEFIVIQIIDDGCGISAETKNRIFEPFFTTKPVGEGTGLGLGIALEIVRKHGGSIDVESYPGEGTEFSVRLPVHIDRMEPQRQR